MMKGWNGLAREGDIRVACLATLPTAVEFVKKVRNILQKCPFVHVGTVPNMAVRGKGSFIVALFQTFDGIRPFGLHAGCL